MTPGGRTSRALAWFSAAAAPLVATHEAGSREPAEARDGDVAGDGLLEQEPLALAFLGGETDPCVDGVPHRALAQVLAVDGDPTRPCATRAIDGLQDLRSTGADQPGKADDLPRSHREADVIELPGPRQTLRPRERVSRRRPPPGRVGNTYSIARPVMSLIRSAVDVSEAESPVATVRPSLRTVTRSAIWRISSSRCVM